MSEAPVFVPLKNMRTSYELWILCPAQANLVWCVRDIDTVHSVTEDLLPRLEGVGISRSSLRSSPKVCVHALQYVDAERREPMNLKHASEMQVYVVDYVYI